MQDNIRISCGVGTQYLWYQCRQACRRNRPWRKTSSTARASSTSASASLIPDAADLGETPVTCLGQHLIGALCVQAIRRPRSRGVRERRVDCSTRVEQSTRPTCLTCPPRGRVSAIAAGMFRNDDCRATLERLAG